MTLKNGLNANAQEVVKSIGTITAQNTNRILKSDTSVFVNEQFSGADDFTDSNGVMNTIDTGNSTADYDALSDRYLLNFNDDASGDSTADPDSFTNPEDAFDGNDGTAATKAINDAAEYTLGKTFGSKLVSAVSGKVGFSGLGGNSITIKLQTFNGSTWDDQVTIFSGTGTASTINFYEELGTNAEGIRISFQENTTASVTLSLYTLEYGEYDSSSTVETNSIISDIVPKSIVVYGDKTLPTDTSITVDVSDDGGSTFSITGKELDSYIDTTSFSGSDLALKFNLATSDTGVTPKLFGYGIAITDS